MTCINPGFVQVMERNSDGACSFVYVENFSDLLCVKFDLSLKVITKVVHISKNQNNKIWVSHTVYLQQQIQLRIQQFQKKGVFGFYYLEFVLGKNN